MGYASDEALDNEALIKEAYKGIRPAPGYPACPEHSEKEKLFSLLSGWYFAHPDSKYFPINTLDDDQVVDYAKRKGMSEEKAKKLMGHLLG